MFDSFFLLQIEHEEKNVSETLECLLVSSSRWFLLTRKVNGFFPSNLHELNIP